MIKLFRIDEKDNVAVTFEAVSVGQTAGVAEDSSFPVLGDVAVGHKVALSDISAGTPVIKYGAAIGLAVRDIKKGEPVHTHNLKTALSDQQTYEYRPKEHSQQPLADFGESLQVYRRKDGRAGIRNELWVIPTVGCVNGVANSIIREFQAENTSDGVDGIYAFKHPYGCSQLGDDHDMTKKTLQNIALNPNAGGVLIVGLGCENNQIDQFKKTLPEFADLSRIYFMEAQAVEDEIEYGVTLLRSLYEKASQDKREIGDWSDIVVGLECGGSDAFSGITANPLIGRASDYIISKGGTAVLTEVPEMFGAEHILMEQCSDREVFEKTVQMINDYKEYYIAHGQPIYENPSPGNKNGGISTLEDKSLGCTRKAGKSKVVDVVKMDQRISRNGLNLLYSPGNDIVATTALGASGCQLVVFSTGRGTPLGGFIPTVKIASNSALAQKKPKWIDFNAGVLADPNVDGDKVLGDFIKKLAAVVSGDETSSEKRDDREIAIFKSGVTL